RIYNDVNVVVNGVMGIIPDGMMLITKALFSFVALYSLDKRFALICLCVFPIVLIIARLYSKRMKKLHKACQETEGQTRSFMLESLQNALVIKTFRGEKVVTDKSRHLQWNNFQLKLKRNNISISANIAFYIAITVGYYFALVWCSYKIAAGIMTVGTLTAILQLFTQLEAPFKSLAGLLPQYYNMVASAERIIEVEDIETISKQPLDGKELYKKMQCIKTEGLSFSYDRENVIFNNAQIIINKGDFIAISGISGIGKSTLLKLLMGIIRQDSGEIFIEADGKRIPVDESTRSMFAYVPQGNMVISGSLRDNITFFMENADEDKIISAAKGADIWDFICELPEGLDTTVGEKGLGLSEGQVQRIAIARALYYDAPVVLLDEATSALDEETEARVLTNLRSMKDKMCIIVSHKQAALDVCDRQLCIKNGIVKFMETNT
ncbi:MAG: ABC transporter ATP-binding protein, partial [Eubacteriales bacterium]|nr:ABC transporter ATP-binding protein [Eubacteriales bacterium]